MHAQIASKITAFAVAVTMNGLMVLGVSYVFNAQAQACAEATASVDAVAPLPALARA